MRAIGPWPSFAESLQLAIQIVQSIQVGVAMLGRQGVMVLGDLAEQPGEPSILDRLRRVRLVQQPFDLAEGVLKFAFGA